MPDWLAVIILGIIEGVTEFLPVSSTGHLLLPQNLGWLPRQPELFNVFIQSGAVLAVVVVFAGRLRELARDWRGVETRDYLLKMGAAFLITAAGGLALKKAGLRLPESAAPVAWATLAGGVLFIGVERWLRGREGAARVTWAVAVAVGLAQVVAAAFPGASRSGTAILAALVLGLARPAAVEFAFLVGVPTLLAAGGYEALKALRAPAAEPIAWGLLLLGTVVAAVTAFASVRWLLRFVRTHTFEGFGWYRVALGALILLLASR